MTRYSGEGLRRSSKIFQSRRPGVGDGAAEGEAAVLDRALEGVPDGEDGKPGRARGRVDARVHARDVVHDVAVGEHHALGSARWCPRCTGASPCPSESRWRRADRTAAPPCAILRFALLQHLFPGVDQHPLFSRARVGLGPLNSMTTILRSFVEAPSHAEEAVRGRPRSPRRRSRSPRGQ